MFTQEQDWLLIENTNLYFWPKLILIFGILWLGYQSTYSSVFLVGFIHPWHEGEGLCLWPWSGYDITGNNCATTCRTGNMVCHWYKVSELCELLRPNPLGKQPVHQPTTMYCLLWVYKPNNICHIALTLRGEPGVMNSPGAVNFVRPGDKICMTLDLIIFDLSNGFSFIHYQSVI